VTSVYCTITRTVLHSVSSPYVTWIFIARPAFKNVGLKYAYIRVYKFNMLKSYVNHAELPIIARSKTKADTNCVAYTFIKMKDNRSKIKF
jgi:hypothetical protein